MQDDDLRDEGLHTAAFEMEDMEAVTNDVAEANITENSEEMSINEAYERYEESEKNKTDEVEEKNVDAELERHIDEQLLNDILVTRPKEEIEGKNEEDEEFNKNIVDNEKDI